MSTDPLLDGHPISLLKVVDLRRELDRFGLTKAGNKKDLFERLRDHLNSQGGDRAEVKGSDESVSRASTRSSASPRKASPTKAPAPASVSSPTKTPPVNRFVTQYLQSQQASLQAVQENKRVLSDKTEAATESTPPAKTILEQLSSGQEKDEASSTISNAGSESAPQTIADDASIPDEKIEVPKEEPKKSASTIKVSSPDKVPQKSSKFSASSSISPRKQPMVLQEDFKSEEEKPKSVEHIDEPSAVELDYEEEESVQDKTSSSPVVEGSKKEEEKTGTPAKIPKKRAIVYDLDEKSSSKDPNDDSAQSSKRMTVSIRPVVATKPSDEPGKHGTNSLGNMRVRSLSPPRKDPSNCVHIMHLKRPYVLAKLQTVLRTFGEFSDEDFWIDDIRSNCIVKYGSMEEAIKARDEMHNIKWPDTPDAPTIIADFTTEERLRERQIDASLTRRTSRQMSLNIGERGGLTVHVTNDQRKTSTDKANEEKGETTSEESRKRKASVSESSKPLDELFKKTKAKPNIYYLPLTEEQIAAKKQRRRRHSPKDIAASKEVSKEDKDVSKEASKGTKGGVPPKEEASKGGAKEASKEEHAD